MRGKKGAGTGLALWVAASVAAAACSSAAPNHPAALGDCIPPPDASCGNGGGGSGGRLSPLDASANGDTGETPVSDAAGCGVAATYVQTSNGECLQCIEGGTNESGPGACCMVDSVCSSISECVTLLLCMQGCAPADQPTCFDTCEAANPAGLSAYNDLVACINGNCTPECPSLPVYSPSDL